MSDARWIEGAPSLAQVADKIAAPVFSRPPPAWWIALAAAAALTAVMVVGIALVFFGGIGELGNNTTVVWGFPIANYVWWIGIGNAGTLISSMLLLTRQKWRSSINRFAEAMTLFAVSIAGLFPIIHMGRPMYWYWLAPYPNVMSLWPQWRSALVWDFWAILSYLIYSIVFWYLGLIPDMAAMRDQAGAWLGKRMFGLFALGWTGSIVQWRLSRQLQTLMAMFAVPLVCSVHSIVGLDFAASLNPGWAETIFPPYFVVGAMFSGFCIVIVLAAVIRKAMGLQDIITVGHFEAMAKICLAASMIMGVSYASEWFSGWYGGSPDDREFLHFLFRGPYQPLYVAMFALNVIVPQALWSPRLRRDIGALVIIALLVNVGMWLERILIILETLSHTFLPSDWRLFVPTLVDGGILAGSLGFFVLLFLLLSRVAPLVAIHETRELVARAQAS
jgi:molybdopterin-containing oxidoreductase family membrane subunit